MTKGKESDIITDFENGIDFLGLTSTLRFEQLSITASAGATSIRIAGTGELLASLSGVESNLIGVEDFVLR